MTTAERFEFETGFVDASGPEVARRGVHGAAVARVAADVARALAAVPAPGFEWDGGGEFSLRVVVVGDVAGLVLDSCARVVATALKIVGLAESEASFSELSAVRVRDSGSPVMRVFVERVPDAEGLKAKLRRLDGPRFTIAEWAWEWGDFEREKLAEVVREVLSKFNFESDVEAAAAAVAERIWAERNHA